ncbi:MAG: ATP-binding cassette domain-containing protein [Nitrospirae bacterium]|nr:ATP-binding cassette domain-containing protein [Nitrospirota bacterium]
MSLTLKVSDIWKEYHGHPVLKGCSFSFDDGGIYVLMGHNGCGKSTFLRLCALLENPDRGNVSYVSEGKPIKNDRELKRKITLMLPDVGVFNTTVFNNAAYGLKIRGIEKNQVKERTNKVLDFVGLINKKSQKALTLSSGETRRLGIARAMVIEPEVLFLDEPTASVDQENAEIIEDIILNISSPPALSGSGRKTTVIIAAHDAVQAERLAAKVLILKDGRIIEK